MYSWQLTGIVMLTSGNCALRAAKSHPDSNGTGDCSQVLSDICNDDACKDDAGSKIFEYSVDSPGMVRVGVVQM
jgi:hypothetical protein